MLLLWLYLPAINLISFLAFGQDKRRARKGEWRTPEATLLLLAAIGGSVGAYFGRALFRHKTRKTGFSIALHLIAIVQIMLLALIAS